MTYSKNFRYLHYASLSVLAKSSVLAMMMMHLTTYR